MKHAAAIEKITRRSDSVSALSRGASNLAAAFGEVQLRKDCDDRACKHPLILGGPHIDSAAFRRERRTLPVASATCSRWMCFMPRFFFLDSGPKGPRTTSERAP